MRVSGKFDAVGRSSSGRNNELQFSCDDGNLGSSPCKNHHTLVYTSGTADGRGSVVVICNHFFKSFEKSIEEGKDKFRRHLSFERRRILSQHDRTKLDTLRRYSLSVDIVREILSAPKSGAGGMEPSHNTYLPMLLDFGLSLLIITSQLGSRNSNLAKGSKNTLRLRTVTVSQGQKKKKRSLWLALQLP